MTVKIEPATCRYLRRFNLGNYQHEELECSVSLPEGATTADGKQAMLEARKIVAECCTQALQAEKAKQS